MAIGRESLQPGIRRCQEVARDIYARTGLRFASPEAIDTRDARLAALTLPILAEWVDKVPENNCRTALLHRFHTPHAAAYLDDLLRWWAKETDSWGSSLITQCLELLANPKNALTIWRASRLLTVPARDFWRVGAKLAKFPTTRDEVLPDLIRAMKKGELNKGEIDCVLKVRHPAVTTWARQLLTSEDQQIRMLAKRALKKASSAPMQLIPQPEGPDHGSMLFSTEVDIDDLDRLLEEIRTRFGTGFVGSFDAETELARAEVDVWLRAPGTAGPLDQELWFRLEDVDVVEVAVVRTRLPAIN